MDMALENDIPFPLIIPKELPIYENMGESTFNALMETGYLQAVREETYSVAEVFEELEQGLWWISINPKGLCYNYDKWISYNKSKKG